MKLPSYISPPLPSLFSSLLVEALPAQPLGKTREEEFFSVHESPFLSSAPPYVPVLPPPRS